MFLFLVPDVHLRNLQKMWVDGLMHIFGFLSVRIFEFSVRFGSGLGTQIRDFLSESRYLAKKSSKTSKNLPQNYIFPRSANLHFPPAFVVFTQDVCPFWLWPTAGFFRKSVRFGIQHFGVLSGVLLTFAHSRPGS
jgi:hypothetical protein